MSENGPGSIITNLKNIQAKILAAQDNYSRTVDKNQSVSLIAVSKRQPESRIDVVLAAGVRVFGENRVQEAQDRWAHRRALHVDLTLHLIGPLQTNKVSDAVALFDVIQVVDREKLATALAKEIAAQNRQIECYIQVNTGEELQKSGIGPKEADEFISYCRDDVKLNVTGLMCIPPIGEEPSMHFAFLQTIAERNELVKLSMGMSDDFEEAIAFGASSVRIGSAIFGSREI